MKQFQRDKMCFWCEKRITPRRNRTKDHVLPKSVNGNNNPDNIVTACLNCNQERSKLTSFCSNHVIFCQKFEKLLNRFEKGQDVKEEILHKIKSYLGQAKKTKKLLLHWQKLESEKLGYSPSATIPFVWEFNLEYIPSLKPIVKQLNHNPRITNCFWCNKFCLTTRDHLYPKSLGGPGTSDNIRRACIYCNNERGKIPAYFFAQLAQKKQLKQLIYEIENKGANNANIKKLRRNIKISKEQIRHVLPVFLHWKQLEIEKLGYSPSAMIPLTWELKLEYIPCLKNILEKIS